MVVVFFFFFSSRRRHTRWPRDWSSDVCSSDLLEAVGELAAIALQRQQLHEQVQRKALDIEAAYESTIAGWARALDMRDRITKGHTQRVTEMALRLAEALGVPEDQLPH